MPFPDDAVLESLTARFLTIVKEYSEREALASPSGRWSYARLYHDVTAVAAAMSEESVGPGRRVCILAQHDGPLVIAMLGTLAAGGVVAVLDPAAPPEHTRSILAEAEPALLVHDAPNAQLAAEVNAEAVPTAPIERLLRGDPTHFVSCPRAADDPAMLAFTSGTSGGPKGAVITHGVLLNLVRGSTNALGIGPHDRMPMLFPASLAVAAYPMFLPLLNGGSLATLDVREVGLAPLPRFLAEERITLAYMAPTVVRFLADAMQGTKLPDMRMIALGGEVVDREVALLTVDLFRPRHLANGFGTTETGIATLEVFTADEVVNLPPGPIPAGRAVPDVDLLLLDDHGHAVATGDVGEIAVLSPFLFDGYFGHPELSATVLEPDPYGRARWSLYRTGDIGSRREDGTLVVLGRGDAKAKVRGRFVVLGEVESTLHAFDEVGDVAVVAEPYDGVTELCAVVSSAPGRAVDPLELRMQLLRTHEAYRVPTRWVVVDDLPRLPNGKVDRQGISRAVTAPTPDRGATPPVVVRTHGDPAQMRHALLDLWTELLPTGPIGLDDDFAHLGGDSILAAQMLVLFEQRTGVTIPMGELVHARTVRQLAAVAARSALHGSDVPSTVAMVQRGDRSRPRLWFVHDLPGSAYRVRHLAAALGADQPVWSFESPLLRGEPNRFADLDEFVATYVRDMRAVQPEGPYWLAGYSFGGICAYEMARQLRHDGLEVAFLGVVDVGPSYRGPNWSERHSPPWPYFGVPHPPPRSTNGADVVRHYVAMARRSPRGAARHLSLRTGLARSIDAVRFGADLRRHGRVRPSWRLWYAWEEHWKLAVRAWDRRRPYDGRLDLLWASQTGSTDGTMGWGPLVAQLVIHRFDGFHDDLLEAHGAPATGAALRAVLDDGPLRGEPTRDVPDLA